MRRLLALGVLTVLLALALAGGASAADSGGAQAPEPKSDVAAGGGAAYEPAPPPARRKSRRKETARRGRARRPDARLRRRGVRRPAAPRYRFPVIGVWDFGSTGSRFDAPRSGHRHQGQDITAAMGTPVVSPATGTVETVAYQASGAGHYVVIDQDGKDRDYVFMHLETGSIGVEEGDRVRAGRQIGRVGNTGRSFGPHLHFEIWVGGGWYTGGRPVDPLPFLRAWAR